MIAVSFGIFVVGVGLFLGGFFLTRNELGISSSQLIDVQLKADNRIFFLIIDALRYDFVAPQPSRHCKNDSPYNCFGTVKRLLTSYPQHSALLRFVADPPTVTAQRLKGLTVGCLPTFIDAGSNMNSQAITDDNFLAQLRRKLNANNNNNSKDLMVALGDDTWEALYPLNTFDHLFMFDSFNTWDLHTVDDGILSHLWKYLPQIQSQNKSKHYELNWKFLVAHFLGVDHIGHTYNAQHPLMSERLQTMDRILSDIVDRLPDDSILFLFGDHGMTLDGEHGGASPDETDSALFVFSKQPFYKGTSDFRTWNSNAGIYEYFESWTEVTSRSIPQIDLVPTLSYLLNIPIPFSSLGKIIPELVYSETNKETNTLLAVLRSNVYQIVKYLIQYFGSPLQNTEADILQNGTSTLTSLEKLVLSIENRNTMSIDFLKFLVKTLALDKELQNEDTCGSKSNSDLQSSSCDIESVTRDYYQFLTNVQNWAKNEWTEFKIVPIIVGLGLMIFSLYLMKDEIAVHTMARIVWCQLQTLGDLFSAELFVILMICVISSGLLVCLSHSFSNSLIVEEGHTSFVLMQTSTAFTYLFALQPVRSATSVIRHGSIMIGQLIVHRLLWSLSKWSSNPAAFKSSTIEDTSATTAKWLGVFCIIAIIKYYQRRPSLRKDAGCKNDDVLHAIFHALAGLYRIAQYGSSNWTPDSVFGQCSLVYKTYGLFAILILSIVFIVSIFTQTIVSEKINRIFIVASALYGLYMLSWQQHLMVLALLFCLDIWTDTAHGILALTSRRCHGLISNDALFWRLLILLHWFCFTRMLFFVTGHGCQFNRLQLQVAFIGREEFSVFYGGFALAVNTLGHEAFPLLFIIRKELNNSDKGMKANVFVSTMLRDYLVFRMLLLFLTCLATFILRRHLMLWAIFAPKLIFEVAMGGVSLGATFVLLYAGNKPN